MADNFPPNITISRDHTSKTEESREIETLQALEAGNIERDETQRDPSDPDGNRQTGSPGSAENAPSPSKRPRLGDAAFNPNQPEIRSVPEIGPVGGGNIQQAQQILMQNGINPNTLTPHQLQQFSQQSPAAQVRSIATYSSNLQQQQSQQMPNRQIANTGIPQGQGSPMMPPGPDGAALDAYYNPETGGPGGMRPVPSGGQPGTGSIHALQDYQLQMLLLEQQNKKRLMMARQKQDNMHGVPQEGPNGPGGPAPPPGTPLSRFVKDGLLPPQQAAQPLIQNGINPNGRSQYPCDSRTDNVRSTTAGPSQPAPLPRMRTTSPSINSGKRNRMETSGKGPGSYELSLVGTSMSCPQDTESLKARIAVLERELNKTTAISDMPEGPRYDILYRRRGEPTWYLDHPTWVVDLDGNVNIKFMRPIALPLEYLRKRPEILFVILRTFSSPSISMEDLSNSAKDRGIDLDVLPLPVPAHESIQIISGQLKDAFNMLFEAVPDLGNSDPEKEIPAPYLFWYQGRTSREVLAQELSTRDQEVLQFLTSWIEDNYREEYDNVDAELGRGYVSPTSLPYLIHPGDVLVSTRKDGVETSLAKSWLIADEPNQDGSSELDHDLDRILVKDTVRGSQGSKTGLVSSQNSSVCSWKADCWSLAYEGTFYFVEKQVSLRVEWDSVGTAVKIQDLSAYPIRFATNHVRDLLARRGSMFWSCRKRCLVSYDDPDSESWEADCGRFIVDYTTYTKMHLNKKKDRTGTSDKTEIPDSVRNHFQLDNQDPPPVPFLYLFPPSAVGYNLRRKKWTDLKVDLVSEVSWNAEAFDTLAVGEETKELVQALVTNKIANERATDIISGKGNGLIMLLHGGPGTGKTFTAETVAELAKKPLYRVTCGDVGTEPEAVEKYLESVLYLGKTWDCVMLLDEADVFLEERALVDLKRNALVSVLLRVLEYYDGILILTSNRVGTFDEAFKSRIQLALHYDDLTGWQRRKIWRTFIERLKSFGDQEIDFDDVVDHLDDLVNLKLNGREIRNAISNARQLALYRKKRMSFKELAHVIDVAGKFDTYLIRVREGLSDDQVARSGGLR